MWLLRGDVRTPKESLHWSWLWEENPLMHRGIESVSAAWWSDAVPTELHPIPCSCLVLGWHWSYSTELVLTFPILHARHRQTATRHLMNQKQQTTVLLLIVKEVIGLFRLFYKFAMLLDSTAPQYPVFMAPKHNHWYKISHTTQSLV